MGQGGRASSWAAFGNGAGEWLPQEALGGLWAARPGWHSPGQGGDEIWSPKPCWGQGKGGWRKPWAGEMSRGGLGMWLVPVGGSWLGCLGLPPGQVGQEGTGALLHFGLSRAQMGQCWMPRAQGGAAAPSLGWLHPLGIAGRVPNQTPALFSAVVLLCEMQRPGG